MSRKGTEVPDVVILVLGGRGRDEAQEVVMGKAEEVNGPR